MSNIDNFEISERIFIRMTVDDSSIPAIVNVLKEVNPNASNEDLILFMAECVERSHKPKDESFMNASIQPSNQRRMTSSSCTGSSTSSCC
jgi:hypothetical protein